MRLVSFQQYPFRFLFYLLAATRDSLFCLVDSSIFYPALFDNSELRNKIYGATDKLNSANKVSRINNQVELDRKLRNRRDKKESLSSQLGGRIRNEKGTAEMRPSAKDSTFDNSYLPRINDRNKKVLNESFQNRSHKIKSTFMTDFSSLDFDMNKGNDVIDKKEKENHHPQENCTSSASIFILF